MWPDPSRRVRSRDERDAKGAGVGHVALVGAGPGDPGLITCKGMERLRQADVVVYDRLVAPALLGEAPLYAERICAAKSSGSHRLEQREIEALLIREARLGKRVVRLKGGDPFVFGRGGEEASALKEAGVPFEVIPGVTSAVAVPAYAGIPLTHRGVAAGFAVWTGHRAPGPSRSFAASRSTSDPTSRTEAGDVQHSGAIDAPTQVILMGVGALDEVVASLIARGRDPKTPAAIVSWGTTGRQRAVTTSLARLADEAKAHSILPPATVIVGDVVALGDAVSWWTPPEGPFAGERIALLRSAAPGDITCAALQSLGAEVALLPIRDASGWIEPIVRCLPDLAAEAMVDRFVFPSDEVARAFVAAQDGELPFEPVFAKAYIEEGDGSLRPLSRCRLQTG